MATYGSQWTNTDRTAGSFRSHLIPETRVKQHFTDIAPLQRRLYQECLPSLQGPDSGLSPESGRLLEQVVGKCGNRTGYLYGGFTTAVGIRAVLHAIQVSHDPLRRVLDFGCGSGRVARWFREWAVDGKFHGVDIDEESIAWCTRNLPGHFSCSSPLPPLEFEDESFELIYGISVVTHFDIDYQRAWLRELLRVSRPGAVVLLSVLGEDKALQSLPPPEFERFREKGFYFKKVSDPTLDRLPDFYQLGFNATQQVYREWSRHFEILGYMKHGPCYEQDLVIMKRRGAGSVGVDARTLGALDLPIVCIDSPAAGTRVDSGRITVSGWAFYPMRNTPVELDLWLDGLRVGSCKTSGERPDVESAYAAFPGVRPDAGFSGFSDANLDSGAHTVWVTVPGIPIPTASSFFFGVGVSG